MKKLITINFICLALMLVSGTLLMNAGYQFVGFIVFATASIGAITILNDMTEKLS